MSNATGRYMLMAVFAIASGISYYYGQHQLAALAGLMFLFIIWSHFKSSSILMASKSFKNGDYKRAAVLLTEVPEPDRLSRGRRGYYEFMMASIALKNGDYQAAEMHFQIASRFPLGTKTDKAFVFIHLANLALRKQDKARALAYAEKAAELAHTERAKELTQRILKEANQL